MGMGFNFICEKCGREYGYGVGIGFMFPRAYEELIKKVKKGKYGKEWKDIANNTENVAIDAEEYLYVCPKCGSWKAEEGLSLYIPKETKEPKGDTNNEPWAIGFDYSNASYVTSWDLKEHYKLLKSYIHKCPKCKTRMHKASSDELYNVPCPKCGGNPIPESVESFLWD